MKCRFSEFSYGYAVTEALVRNHTGQIQAAPVFPSLQEEGKSGGGYDLKLDVSGTPFFLQFKLAECIVQGARTKECQQKLLSAPFHRMRFWSRKVSQQHQMLLDLEEKGNAVWYIAPTFYKSSHFNYHYLNQTVLENSFMLPPSAIGTLDDDEEHYVAFEANRHNWYFFSTPRRGSVSGDFREFAAKMSQRRDHPRSGRLDEEMRRLESEVEEVVARRRSPEFDFLPPPGREPLERVAYMARAYLDSFLFVAQPPSEEANG